MNIQKRALTKRFLNIVTISLLLFFVVACQPEATPIANILPPTNTPDSIETLAPPIRYVLGQHAQYMTSIQQELAKSTLLIPLSGLTQDSTLGIDYDIIADYGTIEGWEQSPVVPTISLIINPNIPPLNNENIDLLIQSGIDGVRIVNQTNISGTQPLAVSTIQQSRIKTELANMGYPDGFEVIIGIAEIPNQTAIIKELQALNFDLIVQSVSLENIAEYLLDNRIHFAIIKWYSVSEKALWTSAVGENNIIDLYQIPISYLASENLKITYADNGFPIASY